MLVLVSKRWVSLSKNLEERDSIRHAPDPDDKRATLIQFSGQGWQFLQDAYPVKLEIEAEYAQKLSEDGIIELRRLVNSFA